MLFIVMITAVIKEKELHRIPIVKSLFKNDAAALSSLQARAAGRVLEDRPWSHTD